MNGFYMLIAVAGLLSILVTFFLGRFFKEKPFVKYIPAVISVLSGIGFYIKSRYFSEGMEDLAYAVLTLISCIVFFISFATAFIMGLLQRRSRRGQ